ncbi:FitA-like ribbon-helix-helix domain-containing protein [Tessaracoccus caeni]|uniref:FitA-like ribbon-helix-helix domain-containing protein n=1 Tax=Tessaracoccus caeni TaxID=3031239 RepID=UPI0023DA0E6E|nr:antitoxin [Tessaracoccus caeni]MDF1489230.1 antitoxin [Tessaracoccus caeni]
MPAITIRKLSEETHRALKARAAQHGVSTEAEVRAILDDAVRPPERTRLGSLLTDIAWAAGPVEIVLERDPAPYEPIDLS